MLQHMYVHLVLSMYQGLQTWLYSISDTFRWGLGNLRLHAYKCLICINLWECVLNAYLPAYINMLLLASMYSRTRSYAGICRHVLFVHQGFHVHSLANIHLHAFSCDCRHMLMGALMTTSVHMLYANVFNTYMHFYALLCARLHRTSHAYSSHVCLRRFWSRLSPRVHTSRLTTI